MPRPTNLTMISLGAGVLLAMLPSLGLTWATPAWILYCAGALCILGVDVLFAPPAKNVVISLSAPSVLYIGEPAAAELHIQINSAGDLMIEALVDLSTTLTPMPLFRGVCPANGMSLSIPLAPKRRGPAKIERVWIRYPGPLGLSQRQVSKDFQHPLAVVPNVMPSRRMALRFFRDRRFSAGLKIERYKGDGSEFDSLREFVVGDEPRDIHWRASARHNKILTRQFRAERNHQVVLALDTGRLMSEPLVGDIPKLDHAVAVALALGFISLKAGDRVGFYSFADRVGPFLAPSSSMLHFQKLEHYSHSVQYSLFETNFTLGLSSLGDRLKRRSLVIVLTDFVDTITAELMIENLGRLARKHMTVFVGMRDPQLQSWVHAQPENVLALNRSVTAAAHQQERELVFSRLHNLGLQTIDAEPKQIGVELINRYLDIKRRERV